MQATLRLRVGLLGVLCEACFRLEDKPEPDVMPQGVAAKINKQANTCIRGSNFVSLQGTAKDLRPS